MELTDSLSRASTSQEMEEAPPLTGLAEDEFDFGAIGDELGPEARLALTLTLTLTLTPTLTLTLHPPRTQTHLFLSVEIGQLPSVCTARNLQRCETIVLPPRTFRAAVHLCTPRPSKVAPRSAPRF